MVLWPGLRKCTEYRGPGQSAMPLWVASSEWLGRILAEDLFNFHANQAFEAWEIEIHARESFSEGSSGFSIGFRALCLRWNGRRCSRRCLLCVLLLRH